jgi:large conductance mechanosensitive channel
LTAAVRHTLIGGRCCGSLALPIAGRELFMIEEFKKFAMRGNVVDLAVAVIIGAAFGGVVNSLVADIIMPIIGSATGGIDFSNYFLPLSSNVTAATLAEAKKQGAVLAWGNFITLAINFLIVAFAMFLVVKGINRLVKKQPAPEAPPSKEVLLLTEIRDALKSR